MEPYIYTGLGNIDLGIQKKGVVNYSDAKLAAFGLDRNSFYRGIKNILKLTSLGILTFSPFILDKAYEYANSNPQILSEIEQEITEEGQKFEDFRQYWLPILMRDEEYSDYTNEDLDKIIKESYNDLYNEEEIGVAEKAEKVLVSEEKQETIAPPRGEEEIFEVNGNQFEGYRLTPDSIEQMRGVIDGTIDSLAPWMNDEQRDFFKNFYEEIGYAESGIQTNEGYYSFKKQMNGPALGYLQIEPETAFSVLNQLDKANPKYRESMDIRIQNTFGYTLDDLIEKVKNDPEGTLNDHSIAFAIMYLKFANRGFRDIEGFKDEGFGSDLNDRARIWKKTWNTEKGAGKENEFIEKYNNAINSI